MATWRCPVLFTLELCKRYLQYILIAMFLDWVPINQHHSLLVVGVQITWKQNGLIFRRINGRNNPTIPSLILISKFPNLFPFFYFSVFCIILQLPPIMQFSSSVVGLVVQVIKLQRLQDLVTESGQKLVTYKPRIVFIFFLYYRLF